MSKVLATGTITTGFDTILVPEEHTGRFGLQLNGNFDSGQFLFLAGISANRQVPRILNPETGTVFALIFSSNGMHYIECFCEIVDLRIQSALGSQSVAYVLYIGERP